MTTLLLACLIAAQPVFTNTHLLGSNANMVITSYPTNLVTTGPKFLTLTLYAHKVTIEQLKLEVVTNWVTVSKTYPVAAEGNLATWWGKATINQTGIITTNLVLETSMGTLRQVVGQEATPSLTRSFDDPHTLIVPGSTGYLRYD